MDNNKNMGGSRLSLLLVALVPAFCSPAQTAPVAESEGDAYRDGYWRAVGRDLRDTAVAPLHWDRREWGLAAGVLAAAWAVQTRDQRFSDWISTGGGKRLGQATEFAKPLGDYHLSLSLLAGFYLYGRVRDDPRARTTARAGLESFLIAGIVTEAGKRLTGRARPNNGHGPRHWGRGHASFPSGHTSSAFAIATVITRQHPGRRWVAPLAYGVATLTGVSRVHDRAHWASDVIIGAAIGYFTGRMVVNRHGGAPPRHAWRLEPALIGDAPAVVLVMRR